MEKLYYAIIYVVTTCLLLTGCVDFQYISDSNVHAKYEQMTSDFIDRCDEEIENKDSSEYWTCVEWAYEFGVNSPDAQPAINRLAVNKQLGIVQYHKIIAGIKLRKAIWSSYEAGELSYEAAKLKVSDIKQ